MADPPVPSSSSSLSRWWTFRAISSQNLEITLETCAPRMINAITFCPSVVTVASLDCPNRQAIRSGFMNGTARVISCVPFCLATFILASFGLGSGWGCVGPIAALGGCCELGGEPHALSSPWAVLKWCRILSGHVAPSLALVTLERGRILVASLHPLPLHQVLYSLACCSGSLCLHPHAPSENLWALSCLARATPTDGRFWTTIAASSTAPTSVATFLGTTQCAGMTVASSSLRAAINWVIWCFSSAIPSTGSVVTTALAHTGSQVSSLSISAFQTVIMSWEYNTPGVL